jgi:hypothetical protein
MANASSGTPSTTIATNAALPLAEHLGDRPAQRGGQFP